MKTLAFCAAAFAVLGSGRSEVFLLPTANRALFARGGEARFFAPTVGKPWTSGTFGCVRSDGWQMHEGLDIRAIQHDKSGEPTDPVRATAAGTVAYVNRRAPLSNYGRYLILRHHIDGLEICSLYAHLSSIRDHLAPGVSVQAGETLGILGRTTNTREGIGKDRAHVHFELAFLVNERFADWLKQKHPNERNDHGAWNGRNLVGLDPRRLLLEQHAQGAAFSLRRFVRSQTELCRVLVRDTDFPWLRRGAALIVPNPRLGRQPPAGYELVLDFNGLPFQIIPRAASDFRSAARFRLLSVNGAEYDRRPCRKLVTRHGSSWELTTRGQDWLDLLTYD